MVLTIEHGEHFLVKRVEKILHHQFEIDLAFAVIPFQLFKEVGEEISVLFVDNAIRGFEHIVKVFLRSEKKCRKKVCNNGMNNTSTKHKKPVNKIC